MLHSSHSASCLGGTALATKLHFATHSSRAGRSSKLRSPVVAAGFLSRFGGQTKGKIAKRESLKQELLKTVSPLERGIAATDQDKATVDNIAKALEALNPNPKTLQMASGKWRLEYTTSESILGTNKPGFLRPWGPIYQTLDAGSLKAENQETAPFYNAVLAELIPESDIKVQVQFKKFKIFGILPVTAPDSAKGELTVTYVDEDLRISRGNRGNLFVLTMVDRDVTL